MQGCHNCKQKPEPGTPYEESPCSRCRTGKEPLVLSHYREDPGSFDVLSVQHPALEYDGSGDDMLSHLLHALSRSVRILVGLKERYPQTYQILDAKMQNPCLSYAELAQRFSCKKQNVQYHLKKAVSLCPELSHVLIIDSRFTPGYCAVKTVRHLSGTGGAI